MEDKENTVNPSTLATANINDGKIVLTYLDNDIEVKGDFFPPAGNGSPISQEYISRLLEKFNIVYGINRKAIDAAYEQCVNSHVLVKDVQIAKGDPPVNELLEYIQLNPMLNYPAAEGKAGDTVDHRARSPFVIVKKGEALAKRKSPKPGKDGKNVHGVSLNHGVVRPDGVSGGENTRMEEKFLLSTIGGQLLVNKGVVSVQDHLVIKGAVGYSTGNINFPGNVEIEGPVSDGFKIYSGGSVIIKQTFDVTDAIIKEDLVVSGGMIGRGKAFVKAGGILKTKFIENCRVASRKTISVDTEIINCNIFTLETLEMGDKGYIVGSEIHAVKGIRAGNIGRQTGKSCRICCGIDFTLEQEKEKNNGLLRILSAKLNRLKELMNDPTNDDEKKAKIETLKQRLEEEQSKAQAKISEILGKLNSYQDAVVEVSGNITPGTQIEICQIAFLVTEPLKKVRIRLEPQSGKLVTEKLK